MIEVVEEGPSFRLERSPEGTNLVVTGPWSSQAADALRDGRADGLDLNYAKGFKDTDLAFIEDWPLKRLTVLARTVKDLDPVQRLAATLESLSVDAVPVPIAVGAFPRLRHLAVSWQQIADRLADAPQLESLYVAGYAGEDLTPLRHNTRVTRLRMKDRPRLRSLRGVEELPALAHLGVYLATSLQDVDPLRAAVTLTELHLESCRSLDDLGPIAGLHDLRVLDVAECGDITSLAPLARLARLEVVWMYGSTRIVDDDLSPLAALPRLTELRIQARRSYWPGVADLQRAIAARA